MNRRKLILVVVLLLIAGAAVWMSIQTPPARLPTGNTLADDPDPQAPESKGTPLDRQAGEAGDETEKAVEKAVDQASAEQAPPEDTVDEESTHQTEASKPVTLKLPEGERAREVRSTVEIRLLGRVVNEQDLPVMGARIMVGGWARADPGPIPEGMSVSPARAFFEDTEVATTDADGRFEVVVSLPMNFEDTAAIGLGIHAAGLFAESEEVEYNWWEGREPKEVKLVLPAKGGISGRCVDTWGGIASGIQVRAYAAKNLEGRFVEATFVGEDGRFELRNLSPGEYVLHLSSGDWIPPEEKIICEVHPEVVSELPFEIVVTPRRRIQLTLRKDDKPFSGADVVAKFVLPDDSVVEMKRRPFKNGVLILLDPPQNAQRLLLTHARHETLELILPDMREDALYELGTYTMIPLE